MKAKKINEVQNFEKNQEPFDNLGIGRWKAYKDLIIPINDFKELGGILKEHMEIFDIEAFRNTGRDRIIGYWIGFDDKQKVDLMYNNRFKSTPVPLMYGGIKVESKIKI